jgi:hypothetical protein
VDSSPGDAATRDDAHVVEDERADVVEKVDDAAAGKVDAAAAADKDDDKAAAAAAAAAHAWPLLLPTPKPAAHPISPSPLPHLVLCSLHADSVQPLH